MSTHCLRRLILLKKKIYNKWSPGLASHTTFSVILSCLFLDPAGLTLEDFSLKKFECLQPVQWQKRKVRPPLLLICVWSIRWEDLVSGPKMLKVEGQTKGKNPNWTISHDDVNRGLKRLILNSRLFGAN